LGWESVAELALARVQAQGWDLVLAKDWEPEPELDQERLDQESLDQESLDQEWLDQE
jgi:hypothetical protein